METRENEGLTRAEHLAWCKVRALEYCDRDDPRQAFASMVSDINAHPETRNHLANQLGMVQLMNGMLTSSVEMRRFIEGYN